MLKSDKTIFSRFLFIKNKKKVRTDANWTDSYPSPEPSYIKKAVKKTCDRIFYGIDSYFQGPLLINNLDIYNSSPDLTGSEPEYSHEWVLNQGIADIAINDIKSSINSVVPEFIFHIASRLNQQLLLYFYTDSVIEEESSEGRYKGYTYTNPTITDKEKVIYITQEYKNRVNAKLISISDWWLKLFHKINALIRMEPTQKTYYLLGCFAPLRYDNLHENQNYMIRGPDSHKLNSTYFFHKRI